MIANFKNYLFEPKSKIGWVHGTITIIGSIILAYLTMMIYTKLMLGDNGVKIVPSMIITPVLIACYSIWLLFSRTIIKSFTKLLALAAIFAIVLKVL